MALVIFCVFLIGNAFCLIQTVNLAANNFILRKIFNYRHNFAVIVSEKIAIVCEIMDANGQIASDLLL